MNNKNNIKVFTKSNKPKIDIDNPPEDNFKVCDIEDNNIATSSVVSDNKACLDSPSKCSTVSTHSLSDDEESELAFSFDSNTRPGTMVSQKARAKTTGLVHTDSNLSLPKINNRSWTSASAANEKPGLWSRIKARFTGRSGTSVQHINAANNWTRSDSMASCVSRRSSKGTNPDNFNETSSYMRACVIQRMHDTSEKLAEKEYKKSIEERERRLEEELARRKKRELIKQEQAIRGQLPGGEHLRQRYSIMYHMNKERKHDALYVSSMLEMLLKKPEFRASLSQFISEEGMMKRNRESDKPAETSNTNTHTANTSDNIEDLTS